MSLREEKELVRRSQAGDREAFGRLYRQYYGRIFAIIYRRTNSREDAEDLVQLTFMKALNGLTGFREEASFSTWLTQIALNACRTHLRTRITHRSWRRAVEAPQSEYRPIWEPSPCKDPETVVYGKECDAILMSAIQRLPDLYREAVRLHLVEDRSYREIHRALQVPIGTLKTWVYRARRELRDREGSRVLQSVHFEKLCTHPDWRVVSN